MVLVTDWNEFKQLDLARVRDGDGTPALLDGRNSTTRATLAALGFHYVGVGLPTATAPVNA